MTGPSWGRQRHGAGGWTLRERPLCSQLKKAEPLDCGMRESGHSRQGGGDRGDGRVEMRTPSDHPEVGVGFRLGPNGLAACLPVFPFSLVLSTSLPVRGSFIIQANSFGGAGVFWDEAPWEAEWGKKKKKQVTAQPSGCLCGGKDGRKRRVVGVRRQGGRRSRSPCHLLSPPSTSVNNSCLLEGF